MMNRSQEEAIHHLEGPALVIAGAGSGKTHVVVSRILHLLKKGVDPGQILAVTFTNKAAVEMRHRIQQLATTAILTSTFHSLGAMILRESIEAMGYPNSFAIYDEEDSHKLLKECFQTLALKDDKAEIKQARIAIGAAKNRLIPPEIVEENFKAIYQLYQKKLIEYKAVDFDDLLYLPIQLFHQCPHILSAYHARWSFISIDEYQDTNMAQHQLVKLLSGEKKNLFAVGDPDQSIYSWRGADLANILNFTVDFPKAKIITLEQNYRSSQTILQGANSLIQHNPSRYKKELWSNQEKGEKIVYYRAENEKKEAIFVIEKLLYYRSHYPLRHCAILYRTNFQSRVFEDVLLQFQLPYTIIGSVSFYQRQEIKDILSWIRMIVGGHDFIAFSRTINLPKRGFGKATLNKMCQEASNSLLNIFDFSIATVEGRSSIDLNQKQNLELKKYIQIILNLRKAIDSRAIHEIIKEIIEQSRYLEYLKEDPETCKERQDNVNQLISKAAEWEAQHPNGKLTEFLEELTLHPSLQEANSDKDAIQMMTLHHGKGLEFAVVFLVGMEEDLFPHLNAKESGATIEEERRLCYVGMTRAKRHLYLTNAETRFVWGGVRSMKPSRFIKEISPQALSYLNYLSTSKEIEPEEITYQFLKGDQVVHKDFGIGTVEKSYSSSLGITYDVRFFINGTTKSLVARYAKLVKKE